MKPPGLGGFEDRGASITDEVSKRGSRYAEPKVSVTGRELGCSTKCRIGLTLVIEAATANAAFQGHRAYNAKLEMI
jgi:hypothetical protein